MLSAGGILDLEGASAAVTILGTTSGSDGAILLNGGATASLQGPVTGGSFSVNGGSTLSVLGTAVGSFYLVSGPSTVRALGTTAGANDTFTVSGDGSTVELGSGNGNFTLAGQDISATHARTIIDNPASQVTMLGFQGSDTIAFSSPAVSVQYTSVADPPEYGGVLEVGSIIPSFCLHEQPTEFAGI